MWLCSDPVDVPMVMVSKFPAATMVLGVVRSEDFVTTEGYNLLNGF